MNGNANTGLIFTNEEKCIGCNRCIDGCPISTANVVYCKDGATKIYVDAEKCIHCGHCFEYCLHGAREYRDDTDMFFDALKRGERISIIVAPAIRTNFPDNYHNLLGYFRASGINKIYDVSFGAEITVWAYLKYMKNSGNDSIIAQPCPVVVNNIEKFNASLLNRLAPVHSPLLCAAIYMNEYMNIHDKIAFISPCIAKKDEINDKNTNGYVSYNVTFRKLLGYLEKNNIDLSKYEEDNYDNNHAELGIIFSKPGGLRENVAYHDISVWVKQVEGAKINSSYLKQYADRMNEGKIIPQIVDILNCEKGCNIGTGSIRNVNDDDDADYIMHSRKNQAEHKNNNGYELFKIFDNSLDYKKFERKYTDKTIIDYQPSVTEIDGVFNDMLKTDEYNRNINCCSCGYQSCTEMAVAIFRKVNARENCIRYSKKMVEIEKEELNLKKEELSTSLDRIKTQNLAIQAMSTPTIKLWEGILVLPVLGVIDSVRAQQMMDSILNKIQETAPKTIILDIHGVAAVDTSVANHLIKITKATKLMGCECLLSGISPAVAQTIVQLGIDMGSIKSHATLSEALAVAFSLVNLEVNSVNK